MAEALSMFWFWAMRLFVSCLVTGFSIALTGTFTVRGTFDALVVGSGLGSAWMVASGTADGCTEVSVTPGIVAVGGIAVVGVSTV